MSMAKHSKKKSPDEPLTVSKIFETIRAKSYLYELWWDLISNIQEKPTYQHLKAMVNDVVNNNLQNLAVRSDEPNEYQRRQSVLTEMSIMTYTLDTVISEVLYQRYQKEFENIIKNLIKDILKGKLKKAPHPNSVFENIESIFNQEHPGSTDKEENDRAMNDTEKSQASNSSKYVEESNAAPARKRGRPKKTSVDQKKPERMNAVPKREKGISPLTPERRIASSFSDKIIHEIPDQESDDESIISAGNLSIVSVSSVHTSELSSFEDTISICSDDEGGKKHISLKVANEMYLRGKLSQIYQFEKKSKRLKEKKAASSISKDLSKINHSRSVNINVSPRKVLPQRIRKPNPKYNSETMYCDVNIYSYPPANSGSKSSEDEMYNKPLGPPKVQRKRKRSSLDKGTGSTPASKISASKGVKTTNSPLLKTSTKCYTTSDLYKLHPITGSFVGSENTAVLF